MESEEGEAWKQNFMFLRDFNFPCLPQVNYCTKTLHSLNVELYMTVNCKPPENSYFMSVHKECTQESDF